MRNGHVQYHKFYMDGMIYQHDIYNDIYLIDTDYKNHDNLLGRTTPFKYTLPDTLIIKNDVDRIVYVSDISDSIEKIIFNNILL